MIGNKTSADLFSTTFMYPTQGDKLVSTTPKTQIGECGERP
jgi:hypothetical protein